MDITIKDNKDARVSLQELHELFQQSFQQWRDSGIDVPALHGTFEDFKAKVEPALVFVAQDGETGKLLAMHCFYGSLRKGHVHGFFLAVSPEAKHQGLATRMLEHETRLFRKKGIRYLRGNTSEAASWSVRWHLKNGYRKVGYRRTEDSNSALVIFRKQIATDWRRHPADLLWTRPLAPLTAKIQYAASYLATNICKTRTGRLNWMGRMAKRIIR